MANTEPPLSDAAHTIAVSAIDAGIRDRLDQCLEDNLHRLGLSHLAAPSKLLLRDLLGSAIDCMYHEAFNTIVKRDFGLEIHGNEDQVAQFYKTELAEHGSKNIAAYCTAQGIALDIGFPAEGKTLISIRIPARCDAVLRKAGTIADALGYRLYLADSVEDGASCLISLDWVEEAGTLRTTPKFLDPADEYEELKNIYRHTGYGVVIFNTSGAIISASPSVFLPFTLSPDENAIRLFSEAIPRNFYNDVLWGLALTQPNGVFENYRVRLRSPLSVNVSILFNVSGFRDDHYAIHTLWQVVAIDESRAQLNEGAILNEARIHNITRNYVPQLVEKKAREAVRMGKTALENEECCVGVLFCDVVGFTSYVENNESSESVINTLNSILGRISGSVKRYGGSIDKFMGDCIMALFHDPAAAVLAAFDMQAHSVDINSLRSRAGQDPLQLRIGIDWGDVVLGNVGTAERLDWTAIGDVVNTASRIEKHCNPGFVLISQAVRDAIRHSGNEGIAFGDIFHLRVKGKQADLAVCYATHRSVGMP